MEAHEKILEQPVLNEYELGQQMIQTNSEANSTTQRLFSVMYPSQNLENTQFYDDDNDKTGTEEGNHLKGQFHFRLIRWVFKSF